jgi:hypothetical protein
MFNGKINSWRTKITAGIFLLLFIGLQRVIVAMGNKKNACRKRGARRAAARSG